MLFCLKATSSVNSLNGEKGKKRPNSAGDESPQKKIKVEQKQNKVSLFVMVIIRFRVQFVINLHEWVSKS